MGSISLIFILGLLVFSAISQSVDDSSEEYIFSRGNGSDVGLSPPVGNLATHAIITSNATCGVNEPETFCKLTEHVNLRSRSSQCQICDANSPDRSKRHPISYAIDGSDRWWQSPTLQNGKQFQWVTITIDLKQMYEVAYIVIKCGPSPRPGNWILEKSIDGTHYFPWQYFAVSDEECWNVYGIRPKHGKPTYTEDDEVICTSYFSKLTPFEGGEIHNSLVNGRPGGSGPSERLRKFTMARYIRLRLQKIRTLHADLMGVGGELWDKSVSQRYFYSIKDIAIGGHCVCFGHSNECVRQQNIEKCMCKHNTCGERCDMCCPLYNQIPWSPGNSTASAPCEKCECYGHADACVYDPQVAVNKESVNTEGIYSGGGVCMGCRDHTQGINCEKCEPGFFRPEGIPLNYKRLCIPCQCNSPGAIGTCFTIEESYISTNYKKNIGDCHCKYGFTGKSCNECEIGFHGFPKCAPCPCDLRGIVNPHCEGECLCKANVEGKFCSKCKPGYFNLEKENPFGCTPCFCNGLTDNCTSSNFALNEFGEYSDWMVMDLHGTKLIPASKVGDTFHIPTEEFNPFQQFYWTSKDFFTGNRIHSYGAFVTFNVSWVEARGDTSGRFIPDFNVVLQSRNSMLGFVRNIYDGNNATIRTQLNEHFCFVLDTDNSITQTDVSEVVCDRESVMEVLSDVRAILLRAKYHTDQIEGMFHGLIIQEANASSQAREGVPRADSIEVCTCPLGYTGSSCEICDQGYRKIDGGSWKTKCIRCECNGHSLSCDQNGTCINCDHNTVGSNCESCIDGFYGDPKSGTPYSCKTCECPLSTQSNNFSPLCNESGKSYVCTQCPTGYEGPFCERCSEGYYGNPAAEGDFCKPCHCNSGNENILCDHLTGECLRCPVGKGGWNCDECKEEYFRISNNDTCNPCDCHIVGSISQQCAAENGNCTCRERFTGRNCSTCMAGFWGSFSTTGCIPCDCDPTGAKGAVCDNETGQCECKSGVGGRRCGKCAEKYFGFSHIGCKPCEGCLTDGYICDSDTGKCVCPKNTEAEGCSKCKKGYWGNPLSSNGCQACNCSAIGSSSSQCSLQTGRCLCEIGYEGNNCDYCVFGYHGYPNCIPCECETTGTLQHHCDLKGLCTCDNKGQCPCKRNVVGEKCSKCADGWSLSKGGECIPCFCFQRTNKCSEGSFVWQRLAETDGREIVGGWEGNLRLRLINNLIVIPEGGKDVYLENDVSFSAPLYWQLPIIFTGDKILSYGGYLRFRVSSDWVGSPFPEDVLNSYPLVQIQGNHKLILEHYPAYTSSDGYYEIKLGEESWRLRHGPSAGLVNKEVLMVALQNLQHILIRATTAPEIIKATLYNVSLDVAVVQQKTERGLTAFGVEVCECPAQYGSTSCQNPKQGFFRWHKKEYITSTVIIDLVGEAKPCQCNNRSKTCDTETGICQGCIDNTGGPTCGDCAPGFYGSPNRGCFGCPCPSSTVHHADSCIQISQYNFQCFCKKGYTGHRCSRCELGYYGDGENGSCYPCSCNPFGSIGSECDDVAGQCHCHPGLTGRDCSYCAPRNVLINRICSSCDDSCTGTLLNDAEFLNRLSTKFNLSSSDAAVWHKLSLLYQDVENLFFDLSKVDFILNFIQSSLSYKNIGEILTTRGRECLTASRNYLLEVSNAKKKSWELEDRIQAILDVVFDEVKRLRGVGSPSNSAVNIPYAVEESRRILQQLQEFSLENGLREANIELTLASDKYKEAVTIAFSPNDPLYNYTKLRDRMFDLKEFLSQAIQNQIQADRVMDTARELLGTVRANTEAIDGFVLEMDMQNIAALDILNRGAYLVSDINEMSMMSEDLTRNIRNYSKGVEIRENDLFEFVPLYRVKYAQPALDHVEYLRQKLKYVEGLFYFATSNTSSEHQAITAYDRLREGFQTTLQIAKTAANFSKEASIRIQTLFRQFPSDAVRSDSETLLEDGFTLRNILEKSIRGRLLEYKDNLDNLKWKIRGRNETLWSIRLEIPILYQMIKDLGIGEIIRGLEETLEFQKDIRQDIHQLEMKIEHDLKHKVDDLKRGPINQSEMHSQMTGVSMGLNELLLKSLNVEAIKIRKESKMNEANEKMRNLKSSIVQAKHKTKTVHVAIGPDETGICFRLYKWQIYGGATEVFFNFAPTKTADSLLFYWPSSTTDDFIALELRDQHIKASWDLGSGVRNLTHPLILSPSEGIDSEDPEPWYRIHYKRVGSEVVLSVGIVDSEDDVLELEHVESEEGNSVLNLIPSDLIHIGGISKERRQGLVSNGLSGCVHGLRVNGEDVGLWDFVGNEGCAPCTECSPSLLETQNIERDYFFDGRGYAIVKRIQSQAFYSKSFDINMEFRTYAEYGILFITTNEAMGQSLSLEIVRGQVKFRVKHSTIESERDVELETTGENVNTGEWIKVQALWVYQKFLQIGQLRVGDKQYTKQIESSELSLDLFNAPYQIGGLSPGQNPRILKSISTNASFMGCMKNLLIDGNAYDPLSYQHYGIESPCGEKVIHVASFEGTGFGEYIGRPIGRERFKVGFSFRTTAPTGLFLISGNGKLTNGSEEAFWAVYLENGEIHVVIHSGNGGNLLEVKDKHRARYDDGDIHDFRLTKKQKRFILFMDDEQVGRENLHATTMQTHNSRQHSLYIGGIETSARENFALVVPQVSKGFSGCIENLYFENEILNFNDPIRVHSVNLGYCSPEASFNLDSSFPEQLSRIQSFSGIETIPEAERCPGTPSESDLDDSSSALHFGDTQESYIGSNLQGSKILKHNFNLTFHFRTFYPNGLLFQGVKKKGGGEYHILSYLKDGQLILRFANRLWSQDLVSGLSNLNDGVWHMVWIVKADDKMSLYIDFLLTSEAIVLRRMKQINKIYVGGIPKGGNDIISNSMQRPDQFRGCIRKLVINSIELEFNGSSVVRYGVNPCFKQIESGSFFGGLSYAIHSYNFTFKSPIELELEFKTQSKNGEILSFVPDFGYRSSPSFSIYINNSHVIASQRLGEEETFAIESSMSLCDGKWHSLKGTFLGRSVSLKVDFLPSVEALSESTNGALSKEVSGTLFIGGQGGRELTRASGFRGCLRNLNLNGERKDWTDMAVLSRVLINACPKIQ